MVRVLLVLAVIMVSGCDVWGDGSGLPPNAILENVSPISLDETTTCIGVERFGPVTVDQDGHRRSEFLGYEKGTYTDRWVLKQLECLVGRSGVITELSGGRLFFVDCAPDGMRIDGPDTVCR